MKCLRFLFYVLLTSTSFAQVEKGTKFLSGSLSTNFSTGSEPLYGQNDYTSNGFSLYVQPSAGVFQSETSALGAGLTYNFRHYSSTARSNNVEQKTTSTSHGPGLELFFRKYKFISEKFALYLNVGIDGDYYSGTSASEMVDSLGVVISSSSGRVDTDISMGASLRPGLLYFISPRWALQSTFGGLYYTISVDQPGGARSSVSHDVGFSLSSNIGFGLTLFLSRGKASENS